MYTINFILNPLRVSASLHMNRRGSIHSVSYFHCQSGKMNLFRLKVPISNFKTCLTYSFLHCQLYTSLEPVPTIEPITNHTRTSVSTAVVRQVECKNFPNDCQVTIAYYDEDGCCLGTFQIAETDHLLTKLTDTTKRIKVKATDCYENMAETEFTIDDMTGR